ncbi:B12-binding domain-containing radical SAM protein [Acetivibrio straminisolvens]|uniref:B12-binding domain-containing radical SAM protein n=1 Tax=Acetivibrio straminisolvens TaxID=253314 RepID=UPI00223EBBAF|nr:radical SAM protein [Acetivibrio straminisolvens]
MIRNICFLQAPSESGLQYPDNMTVLPLSLALGVLAGYLRNKGIEVDLIDLNAGFSDKFSNDEDKKKLEICFDKEAVLSYLKGEDNQCIDSLIEYMLSEVDIDSYDSFGISIGADFSFVQIHCGFLIAKFLKSKYSKTVFIGGNNVSYLYIFRDVFLELWTAALQNLTFIIKGPGEEVIWDIIKGLNDGEDMDALVNIGGLVRLIGNEVVANAEYRPQVVRPDWEGLDLKYYKKYMCDDTTGDKKSERAASDNKVYVYKWPDTFIDSPGQLVNKYNKTKKAKDVLPRLIVPYIFNYNCPYNCAFCTQSDYDRGSVVGGQAEHVIEDIKALIEKYQTNYFYFLNNAFNYSAKFADTFCQEVRAQGIKLYWSDCGRFNNLTYERLKQMREAGCVKLTFGFETGSEKILKLIDKRLDLAHAEEVLKWCHELGIWCDIEVIVGLPHEFEEDFAATKSFLERNQKYINYIWINEYFVVPNSLIGRFPERYGIELIRDRTTYNDLLKNNLEYFQSGRIPSTQNAKIYGYNEINGRDYSQIVEENNRRIETLNKMQKMEFYEVSQFYKLFLNKK